MLNKDPYEAAMLKVPRNLSYVYTKMNVVGDKVILPSFEYCLNFCDWSVSFNERDEDEDPREQNDEETESEKIEPFVEMFQGQNNIPIGVLKYLYTPEILDHCRENNIKLMARQTASPTREYSVIVKSDPKPSLTPIDLTFQSKMFFYKIEVHSSILLYTFLGFSSIYFI